MSSSNKKEEILGLVDVLDRSVAEMMPTTASSAPPGSASEAVKAFASAAGQLEAFLQQLQTVQAPQPDPELASMEAEVQEKERLIALSRAKLQHWQALLSKQEALQDNTLFAGIGGS